jgi:hypothetical protein
MNRLSLANVIAFIIGVIILVGFLDREGRLSRILRGTSYEEASTESPRPRDFKLSHGEEETTSASTALPDPPKVEPSPAPSPRSRLFFPIPPDILKLPQFDAMSSWIDNEWELSRSEYFLSTRRSAKLLMTEVSLRTKLYKLKPGEGVLFLPSMESEFDKVLRAGVAGKFKFESERSFLNAGKLKSTETFCSLDLAGNKFGNELHYESLERGILIDSIKILLDKKGFSGVELKGAMKANRVLGQIISVSCYINDVGGV